ncbi:septum formation family protein [Arthrobacter sp. efr-133-TYG-120]|uniref:septum formation family protein n=1 Tax=Arthrobacter sp. efr-133-TYG-120 TaxID=3040280 RepID=UPI00254DEFF1|nr:septum formation family protein [Arthrobacter sp. efr-133-TYG-120]
MKGANSDMGQDNMIQGNNGTGDNESPVDPGSGTWYSGTSGTFPDAGMPGETGPEGPAPSEKGSSLRTALDAITRYRLIIGGIVLAVLILIGVVIWVLVGALANRPAAAPIPAPATSTSRGPLPADVEAKDYQLGDCFADFDSNAIKSKVVDCTTDHSAQLGAIFRYKADDTFPGATALRDKGREICRDLVLNEASTKYALLQQNVYPSATSWDNGDRRVDCFIVVNSGNTLKESVLQK